LILGDGGAQAAFFHLKLDDCLDDPQETDRRLSLLFKTGAEVLERAILRELQKRIGVTFKETDFSFEKGVDELQRFTATMARTGK